MIVFFGYRDDRALGLAVEAARARNAEWVMVDQRRSGTADICLELGDGGVAGSLFLDGNRLDLSEVRGVYARPLAPVVDGNGAELQHATALHDAFVQWLDLTASEVINRPSNMHSNSSKPFQAQLLAECGFDVPETLITSHPEEATAFWRQHTDVVFKSISGVRSIVCRLDAQRARQLQRLSTLPTQFQVFIPGTDVRVHVVGRRLFATEIRSEAVDYRYARRDGLDAELTAIDIPDVVADRCLRLAERLELPFCGIDLRRRPDGSFVCFEVNPMPGYSYYESATGQAISGALIALLGQEDY